MKELKRILKVLWNGGEAEIGILFLVGYLVFTLAAFVDNVTFSTVLYIWGLVIFGRQFYVIIKRVIANRKDKQI